MSFTQNDFFVDLQIYMQTETKLFVSDIKNLSLKLLNLSLT